MQKQESSTDPCVTQCNWDRVVLKCPKMRNTRKSNQHIKLIRHKFLHRSNLPKITTFLLIKERRHVLYLIIVAGYERLYSEKNQSQAHFTHPMWNPVSSKKTFVSINLHLKETLMCFQLYNWLELLQMYSGITLTSLDHLFISVACTNLMEILGNSVAKY